MGVNSAPGPLHINNTFLETTILPTVITAAPLRTWVLPRPTTSTFEISFKGIPACSVNLYPWSLQHP